MICLFVWRAAADPSPGQPSNLERPHETALIVTPQVIDRYFDIARTNHPRFKAAEARVAASRADVESVRTWEDPTFKLGGTVSSPRGANLREDGDLVYGAEQKLPLFGKARFQRKSVEQETRAAQVAAEYQFQILRRDLSLALFRAALAQRACELGRQDQAQLELWVQNADQRYAAGGGSQVEVLRLQNELTRLRQELVTRTNELGHQQVTINRLLNRPELASLPSFALPAPADPLNYSEALINLAMRNEPQLRMLRQEIDVAHSRAAVARRQRFPEFSLGIEGRQFSGDGGFREGTFMLGMSVPWFNRTSYRKAVQKEERKAEAAFWDAQDYELGVREEVHLLLVRADAARREALTYSSEILPRSELAVNSAASSWMANRGPFNDVMEGRRMHLEARLGYARAIAEQYQALTELLLCCGLTDLEGLETEPQPSSQPNLKTTPETK